MTNSSLQGVKSSRFQCVFEVLPLLVGACSAFDLMRLFAFFLKMCDQFFYLEQIKSDERFSKL